jgi:hypothetical protein
MLAATKDYMIDLINPDHLDFGEKIWILLSALVMSVDIKRLMK